MPIYSSFITPMRGELSPRALVRWYYGLSKYMILSLGSSTISTTGLTNVKADPWVLLCLWNQVCRNKAARKQVILLYYQQIWVTRDEMGSLDLSSCWCMGGDRGKTAPTFCVSQTAAWHTQQKHLHHGWYKYSAMAPLHAPRSIANTRSVPLGGRMICWDSVGQGKQSCRSLPRRWPLCSLRGEHAVHRSVQLGWLCLPVAPIHSQNFYCRFMLS